MTDIFVLTIQWRSWDRTVEAFRTDKAAKARLKQIALTEYPDEDGDADLFSEHGHSWYIDVVTLPAKEIANG